MNKKNGNQIFKKNISVSILYLMSADLVNAVLGILFAFVLGRFFGAEYLGIYTFSFMLATMLWTLGESGYEVEIPREIAQEPDRMKALIGDAQVFKTRILLFGFPIFCFYGMIALGEWYFLAILPWVIPASANMTLKSVCRGLKRFSSISIIEISTSLFLYPTMTLVLWLTANIAYVFLVLVFSELIKMFLYLYTVRQIENFSLDILFPYTKSLFSFSSTIARIKERRGFTFVNLLTMMQYRSTLLILPLFQSNYMVGVFTVGMRFVSLLRLLPASTVNVLLPEFSSESRTEHKSLLKKSLFYMFLINAIIAVSIFALAELIIDLTFQISEAIGILKIMIWAIIPISMHQIVESFLISRNYELQISKSLFATALMTFIAVVVVNFFYGINGIAFIFVVGEIVLLTLYLFLLQSSEQRERK
ncbi:MAG: oligosaccharide flippase family protein [Desulfobulbaceae bacterium]|nr:oligosaccharide flippase family protein [Desulfobulbaceae bacterium]